MDTLPYPPGSEVDGIAVGQATAATEEEGDEEENAIVVRVHYNVPTVVSVTPPTALYAGVPAMCSGIKVLFAASGEDELRQEWFLHPADGSPRVLVSTLPVFVPSQESVGLAVTYRCAAIGTDGATGTWTELDLPPVRPFGDMQPRWAHLSKEQTKASPENLRVMCYNVLHSDFASTNFAKRVLYPFAAKVLEMSYRQSRIAMEIGASHSDIVCLQECGLDVYQKFYQHIFQHHRMDSKYTNKSGQVREGCLTAFSQDRFELVSYDSIKLSWPTFVEEQPALAQQLAPYKHLVEALQCITSIATVTVLKDRLVPNRFVLVGNTHLFYHANGCHIRVLQVYLFSHFVHRWKQQTVAANPDANISVILCGITT